MARSTKCRSQQDVASTKRRGRRNGFDELSGDDGMTCHEFIHICLQTSLYAVTSRLIGYFVAPPFNTLKSTKIESRVYQRRLRQVLKSRIMYGPQEIRMYFSDLYWHLPYRVSLTAGSHKQHRMYFLLYISNCKSRKRRTYCRVIVWVLRENRSSPVLYRPSDYALCSVIWTFVAIITWLQLTSQLKVLQWLSLHGRTDWILELR